MSGGAIFDVNIDGEIYHLYDSKGSEECKYCGEKHVIYKLQHKAKYNSKIKIDDQEIEIPIEFNEIKDFCQKLRQVYDNFEDRVENSSRYGEVLNKFFDELESKQQVFYVYRMIRVAHRTAYNVELVGIVSSQDKASDLIRKDMDSLIKQAEAEMEKDKPVARRRVSYAVSLDKSFTTPGNVY